MGMDKDHIHILCGAHSKDISRSDCPDIQEYCSERNILGGNHRLRKIYVVENFGQMGIMWQL